MRSKYGIGSFELESSVNGFPFSKKVDIDLKSVRLDCVSLLNCKISKKLLVMFVESVHALILS